MAEERPLPGRAEPGTRGAAPPPAFYALSGGGWRDWWTLLHPPYTAWHLSYVVLGASAAPSVDLVGLGAALVAFFLAVGLGAHALDELNGRPLRTRIGTRVLAIVATASIGGAVAIGIAGIGRIGPSLTAFIAFGAFIVVAYNLELAGGVFHSDLWFALAWGGFPALTGHLAAGGTIRPAGLLVAAGCVAASAAQRALSTPVRALRRRTSRVVGAIARDDGTVVPIERETLMQPSERALRALALALPAIATGALLARILPSG